MRLTLPLEVMIPRKTREDKRFPLNLNIYRNAHHFTLNAAKIEMVEHVKLALPEAYHLTPPFRFIYTIFPATGRAFDLGNVGSVVQKFADDALIQLGVIKGDNMKIVREVVYRYGGVDKENPRAELHIENIEGGFGNVQ